MTGVLISLAGVQANNKRIEYQKRVFTVRVGDSHFVSDRNVFESLRPLSRRVKAWFAQRAIVKNADGAGNYPKIVGNRKSISILPFVENAFI